MSRYRQRTARSDPERETSGLAGWMYTDLLLGLAVVFLGSIGVVLLGTGDEEPPIVEAGEETTEPGSEPSADPTTAPSSTTTTTTSTVPGVQVEEIEICPVLYLPPEDPEEAFKIRITGRKSPEELAAEFRENIGQRIIAENRRLPAGVPPFRFDDLNIALAIINHGPSDQTPGGEVSEEVFNDLVASFPNQFRDAVVRPGKISDGQVRTSIEIFLLIERPCTT